MGMLDIVLQVAYNEGNHGGFFYTVLKACADANDEVIKGLRDMGLQDDFKTKDGKIDCPAGKWHDKCSEGGEYECSCSKTPPVDPKKDPKYKHKDYEQCYATASLCENPKSICAGSTGKQCVDGDSYCQCTPNHN